MEELQTNKRRTSRRRNIAKLKDGALKAPLKAGNKTKKVNSNLVRISDLLADGRDSLAMLKVSKMRTRDLISIEKVLDSLCESVSLLTKEVSLLEKQVYEEQETINQANNQANPE